MLDFETVTKKDLTVMHGKKGIILNKMLLQRQNAFQNLNQIKELHKTRLMIEDAMESTNDPEILRALDDAYTKTEFALQDQWGFPRDAKFHRFWERPKCGCPTMDNSDAYPSGRYVISGGCPVHGQQIVAD